VAAGSAARVAGSAVSPAGRADSHAIVSFQRDSAAKRLARKAAGKTHSRMSIASLRGSRAEKIPRNQAVPQLHRSATPAV
jgi:hypothetical protein